MSKNDHPPAQPWHWPTEQELAAGFLPGVPVLGREPEPEPEPEPERLRVTRLIECLPFRPSVRDNTPPRGARLPHPLRIRPRCTPGQGLAQKACTRPVSQIQLASVR